MKKVKLMLFTWVCVPDKCWKWRLEVGIDKVMTRKKLKNAINWPKNIFTIWYTAFIFSVFFFVFVILCQFQCLSLSACVLLSNIKTFITFNSIVFLITSSSHPSLHLPLLSALLSPLHSPHSDYACVFQAIFLTQCPDPANSPINPAAIFHWSSSMQTTRHWTNPSRKYQCASR